jgi:aminoethylphosphonate catabolism LysR family transcriptional regulator
MKDWINFPLVVRIQDIRIFAYCRNWVWITVSTFKKTLNFKRLRCFHTVAIEGSFTQAAHALGVGQPSITTHVKALEDDYGIELFARHGHNIELTDLGRSLLAITHRIFSLEEEAVGALTEASGLHTGHLKIGAIGPSQVTDMILAFGRKYPDVELSVALGNSQDVLSRILNFQDDVGILPLESEEGRLHTVPFGENRIVLLVRTDHRWADLKEISIHNLEGERFVLREDGSATRHAFEDALAKANVSIKPVLAIGSRDAVREAVANGLGIGIALEDETLRHERLKTLRIADADIILHPHVACLEDRRNAPMIKAFLDLVAETAQDGAS